MPYRKDNNPFRDEYAPGDLVRWVFDHPKSPPGLVLRMFTQDNCPWVEVWWCDSKRTTKILPDDLELVCSGSST
jgi:hypothetical protein